MNQKPSTELLKRCTGDDRKAHFELYGLCFELMLGVCRRYFKTEEEIKPALNFAFLRVIQSLPALLQKEEQVEFYQWVRKITLHHIIDEYRKNKKYREHIFYPPELQWQGMEQERGYLAANGSDFADEIERALQQLPPMAKAVFNLYAVEGFQHDEIAHMLQISANTSKVHYMRARQKLQVLLKDLKTVL